MLTFTINPNVNVLCHCSMAPNKPHSTLSCNTSPDVLTQRKSASQYPRSLPAVLPSLLPLHLIARLLEVTLHCTILIQNSHKALFGGERWQSLQDSIHMWNVKYANCIIKHPVWSPALMWFLMLLILLSLWTKCLLFCLLLGRMSVRIKITSVRQTATDEVLFYVSKTIVWELKSDVKHCCRSKSESAFLGKWMSYLCWCFTVRKWLYVHFQTIVGAVVTSTNVHHGSWFSPCPVQLIWSQFYTRCTVVRQFTRLLFKKKQHVWSASDIK